MLWPAFHFHSVLLFFVNLWPISTLYVAYMVHAVANMVCGRYCRFPLYCYWIVCRWKALTHHICIAACGKQLFRGILRTWICMPLTTYITGHQSFGMLCLLSMEDDWNASLQVGALNCTWRLYSCTGALCTITGLWRLFTYCARDLAQWASSRFIEPITVSLFLAAKPKHRLGQALFLLKNRFLTLILPNLNRSA